MTLSQVFGNDVVIQIHSKKFADKQEGKSTSSLTIAPPCFFLNGSNFKMACKQNLDLRCVLISDPSTFGAGPKIRLHTPKAVTYHEQS